MLSLVSSIKRSLDFPGTDKVRYWKRKSKLLSTQPKDGGHSPQYECEGNLLYVLVAIPSHSKWEGANDAGPERTSAETGFTSNKSTCTSHSITNFVKESENPLSDNKSAKTKDVIGAG